MSDDPVGATHGRGQGDLRHRVQGDLLQVLDRVQSGEWPRVEVTKLRPVVGRGRRAEHGHHLAARTDSH
jgi:hypothetical protein